MALLLRHRQPRRPGGDRLHGDIDEVPKGGLLMLAGGRSPEGQEAVEALFLTLYL